MVFKLYECSNEFELNYKKKSFDFLCLVFSRVETLIFNFFKINLNFNKKNINKLLIFNLNFLFKKRNKVKSLIINKEKLKFKII